MRCTVRLLTPSGCPNGGWAVREVECQTLREGRGIAAAHVAGKPLIGSLARSRPMALEAEVISTRGAEEFEQTVHMWDPWSERWA